MVLHLALRTVFCWVLLSASVTVFLLAGRVCVALGCLQIHHTKTEDWARREKVNAVLGQMLVIPRVDFETLLQY
jgi:hypothetical protein